MAVWTLKERNELARANEVIDVAPICLWGGGATPSTINVIDQVNPVTTGDATDFGDLIAARQYMGGMGNKIKGIYGGGDGASNVIQSTAIFATGGNSSDFGDLTVGRLGLTAVGNDTRIIFAGGDNAPSYKNEIDQVNFATTGNATDFGNLQTAESFCGGASSTTRGVITGGNAGGDAPAATGPEATTHLITLATLGDATDFGEMVTAKNQNTAASNNVKGVVTNGQATLGNGSYEQFFIATTGSFTNFGQLTAGRFFERGAGSQVAQRGLFGGGANPSNVNVIDFCSFTSGSSFTDFGDLAAAKKSAEGLSNNAGGIGGSYPDLVQRPSATYMPGSGRMLHAAGQAPGDTQSIGIFHIPTLGNESDFGDLLAAIESPAGNSSHTRALYTGGDNPNTDVIASIEMQSRGNCSDFGNLTVARRSSGGASNSTRGLTAAGYSSSKTNIIDYVTIASTGNATDFGDCTQTNNGMCGFSSPTRAVFGGGEAPADDATNVIMYVTIASTGDATDFGDLLAASSNMHASGCSSDIRGIFCGGLVPSNSNVIQYSTIASTGNATDFGDLTQARYGVGAGSNNTRAVMSGGDTGSKVNTTDYVTIASTGNAADFGDQLLSARQRTPATDSHGGLQG